MQSFIQQYAPHMDEYFGRTEEEVRAIDERKRTQYIEEEKLHIHLLHMQQMATGNVTPAPPFPEYDTNGRIKITKEYLDFVMYRDLAPLQELKKLREDERELMYEVTKTREILDRLSFGDEKGKKSRKMLCNRYVPEEELETDDEEMEEAGTSKATDPLLKKTDKIEEDSEKVEDGRPATSTTSIMEQVHF
ncbi:unnamed protein product [Caenorhabditis bovis]|nr:unnamed protein product [Caenorhabditis bovis]